VDLALRGDLINNCNEGKGMKEKLEHVEEGGKLATPPLRTSWIHWIPSQMLKPVPR